MVFRFLSSLFGVRPPGASRLRRFLFVAICFTLLTFAAYYFMLDSIDSGEKSFLGFDAGVERNDGRLRHMPEAVQVKEMKKGDWAQQKWILDHAVGSFREEAAGYKGSVKKELHLFYYAWWGNTTFDSDWVHWNHAYLPAPGKQSDAPREYHQPPDDIGATFYPFLGPYSSQDSRLIRKHMELMKLSGADVVALSWYPSGMSDANGRPVDPLVPVLLEIADNYGLKVAFHIEPFDKRDAASMRSAISYIITTYGKHNAFYRYKKSPTIPALPLMYVYDSYLVSNTEWHKLLLPPTQGGDQQLSIRDTKFDAFLVGLSLHSTDLVQLKSNGFDGAYTYFAANGMTECSTQSKWSFLAKKAAQLGLLFIPSAGPGYDDTAVRPWNKATTRSRGEHGETLATSLKMAIKAAMDQSDSNNDNAIVSLTSFNEWHEGTQIEPARPFTSERPYRKYLDYLPHDPFFYLKLTREIVENSWKHKGADQRPTTTAQVLPNQHQDN